MRPPICCICRARFSPSKTEGGLVYFKLSEADEKFNNRMKEKRMVGHPAGRDWFCELHIEKAKTFKHLTLKEALTLIKEKPAIQFQNIHLSTDRLVLRPVLSKDKAMVFQLRADPDINRYIIRDLMKEDQEAVEFIESIQADMRRNQIIYWMLEAKEGGHTLGSICLWSFSEDRQTAELGYTLHTLFHGQGYMQEAVTAVLQYGFEALALKQIEAFTHYANERSLHLLEKNNFIKMPERKDPGFDHNVIYVLSKSDWQQAR